MMMGRARRAALAKTGQEAAGNDQADDGDDLEDGPETPGTAAYVGSALILGAIAALALGAYYFLIR